MKYTPIHLLALATQLFDCVQWQHVTLTTRLFLNPSFTWGAPTLFLYTYREEMFYLTTHSTHFIYGYMASDIWLRTIMIVRKETRCLHIGYSYRLKARVLLYAPSHRQDSTYHGLCYTSRGVYTYSSQSYKL